MNINPNTSINLLQLVEMTAKKERINTIERSTAGSGFGQRNFNGKWSGYDLNNAPTVKYKGNKYNVSNTAYSSKRRNDHVNLRTGEKFIGAAWR